MSLPAPFPLPTGLGRLGRLGRHGRLFGCALALAGLGLPDTSALAEPKYEDHSPRLLLEAPSEVAVGDTVLITVLASSRWGPEGPDVPTAGIERVVRLEISTTDPSAEFEKRCHLREGDHGRAGVRVVFRSEGLHHVLAAGEAGLTGSSNPIRVTLEAPPEPVFWGDLHGHLHTPGAGHAGVLPVADFATYLQEGFDYARHASRLDFAAFTPHLQTAGGLGRTVGSGPDASSPWDAVLQVVRAANAPGEFLAFPGFEWQGDAGDHCVIYPAPGPLQASSDFLELCRSVKERGALLNAHAVYLPSEFRFGNDVLTGIEVTRDSHGTEWLGDSAIARGVVTAFLGGSDTHGGALGSTSLTGLRAPGLSGPAVFEAIRNGHTWATNGERIVLDFEVDVSGAMPRVDVSGVGTAPIERIEIRRNGQVMAEARGFGDALEFRFSWEDDNLLRPECVSGSAIYHARVIQTSWNRYDSSQRDVAITSPVAVAITAAHFDAAHVRRGGVADAPPGAALVALRDVWSRLGYAPDVATPALPRPEDAVQSFAPMLGELDAAAQRVRQLSTQDPALMELAMLTSSFPKVARAITSMEAARVPLGKTDVGAIRAATRRAQEQVATAEASLRAVDRSAVDRVWFASAQLLDRSRLLMEEAAVAMSGTSGVSFRVSDEHSRSEWSLPVDARVWARLSPETARGLELAQSVHEHWGYTDATPTPDSTDVARLRVIAEGNPDDATLVGRGWSVPFKPARNGWVASIPSFRVPAPSDEPLMIRFEQPTRLRQVFLEGPGGERLPKPGRVAAFDLARLAGVASATIAVADAPVIAELRRSGPRGAAPIWSGRLDVGTHRLAFPPDVLAESDDLTLYWGFAGWHHAGAALLPGHEAARARGFGALRDGRTLVALADSLMLVDPLTATVTPIGYPPGRSLEAGRAFCVADLGPRGVLVRGAGGPGSSWAHLLDPETSEWSDLASLVGLPEGDLGPSTGTVTADASGRLSWLTGKTLYQLDSSGQFTSAEQDVSGRLLGTGITGQAVVGLPSGGAAQLTTAGAVHHRMEGSALAGDHAGGVLVLDGINARHTELATGIRVSWVLPDGHRAGPYLLDVRTSPRAAAPVAGEAVFAAITADGTLLLLSGTTHWRRAPGHDWWGAVVERWDPVWAGETTRR